MKASMLLLPFVIGCGTDEPLLAEDLPAKPVSVMSFNVLCSLCNTKEYDPWQERLEHFRDLFQRHDPDLLGSQELTPLAGEIEAMLDVLPGRGAVYFRPEEGLPYPDAAIFYRKSRFQLLEEGSYWLSPTPDVPRSTGFADPQLARLVVWARFRDRNGGRELVFIDTHFDNNSPSQELSAPLTQERTAPWVASHPVIFAGDFNAKPNSAAYSILTTDDSHGFVFQNAYDLAAEKGIVENQSPDPAYDPAQRIDHVFLAGDGRLFDVHNWWADLFVYGPNQLYPSDHFAITTTLDYE
jgi:endonuclease/exonuclease/phosphatase family metal-dependent hydrolase